MKVNLQGDLVAFKIDLDILDAIENSHTEHRNEKCAEDNGSEAPLRVACLPPIRRCGTPAVACNQHGQQETMEPKPHLR